MQGSATFVYIVGLSLIAGQPLFVVQAFEEGDEGWCSLGGHGDDGGDEDGDKDDNGDAGAEGSEEVKKKKRMIFEDTTCTGNCDCIF